MVFNFENDLKGTTDSDKIDRIMEEITDWKITEFTLADTTLTRGYKHFCVSLTGLQCSFKVKFLCQSMIAF